eukprot:CAMPEP_0204615916 /NCGR_PEP_ID=MMETSP0717-20131115/3281_1 /ASSEMBLY_ACC=CAM_ASM_000666 /TAXON_ID=230516 /ORGANISM="Chaetoceros curvisetus" /LENGTH=281 /DNA_ID=CAMNT_0051628969 /DNA_START=39 /DNA_END=884 /DNA_ORIENTATION=-
MKDNANPTIYSISNERKDGGDYIATEFLKRFSHGANSEAVNDAHDSLYHLDPSQLLTPLERSIQTALYDINGHYIQNGGSAGGGDDDNPLNIISMAGIKCGGRNSRDNDGMERLYHFRPASCKANTDEVMEDKKSKRRDPITASEVFDIIRNIQDPEHPLTLQQLNVVNCDHVEVYDALANYETSSTPPSSHSTIDVRFTPTIPHCSMATLIGLCIRVKLLRSLPKRFKVTVRINPGTHASEMAVNRQLNDKERVIAALENPHLLGVVNKCIANGMKANGE